MKKNILIYLLVAFGGISMLLTSCYKEDDSVLYSRQVVLAGSFEDLNNKLDKINGDIKDLYDLYLKLKGAKDLTATVTYVDADGKETDKDKAVGVEVFLSDGTKFVVPFGKDGKDGKDGKTPVITISEDGFWVINGEKTDKKVQGADGKDGKTPKISAKQDPNNTSDENFYWTISWDGGKTDEFITDPSGNKVKANGDPGPKGDKGDQGPKGTQPISSITEDKDKGTITITMGDTSYEIPLTKDDPNYQFILKPQDGTVNQATDDQGVVADHPVSDEVGGHGKNHYNDVDKRVMFDGPSETITIPFDISDNLTEVKASSFPRGWKYTIDRAAKTITITAPSQAWSSVTPHKDEASFYAQTADGTTKQIIRRLKLGLSVRFFISFFHNEVKTSWIIKNKEYNKISFGTNKETKYVRKTFKVNKTTGDWEAVTDETANLLNADKNLTGTVEEIEASFRQEPKLSIAKPEELDDTKVGMVNALYDPNRFDMVYYPERIKQPASTVETNPYAFELRVKPSATPHPNPDKYVYLDPVPYDTYISAGSFTSGMFSDKVTFPLVRKTQVITIYIGDPAKSLGLPAGEAFDMSKVVIKAPSPNVASVSSVDYYPNNIKAITRVDATMLNENGESYFRVIKAGADGKTHDDTNVDYHMARKYSIDEFITGVKPGTTRLQKEDAGDDKVSEVFIAKFCTVVCSDSFENRFMIEYTQADGTVIKKYMSKSSNEHFQVGVGGTRFTYGHNFWHARFGVHYGWMLSYIPGDGTVAGSKILRTVTDRTTANNDVDDAGMMEW